jgi:hypothetical protein
MMRRWETSPILLLDGSLWINRKDGMTLFLLSMTNVILRQYTTLMLRLWMID